MGIKHLKMLLSNLCQKSGVHHYPTVNEFLEKEKLRLYKDHITENQINNPLKQMMIKQSLKNKPYFVGIDASLYASRYKRVFKKIEYGFLRQIMLTLSSKMIPIYIFDGSAPDQKRKTITNRYNKKQKIRSKLENLLFSDSGDKPEFLSQLSLDELINHINNTYYKLKCLDINSNSIVNVINNTKTETDMTFDLCFDGDLKNDTNILLYDIEYKDPEYHEFIRLSKKSMSIDYDDIQNLKNFLDLLRIPYITANKEADDLMAFLYKKGIIQACQSDDMDMLPKGCGNVIQITNKGISQYILNDILNELGIDHKQFVDLCILLGSDYYTTYLPKLKPFDLYYMFRTDPNPSLENFVVKYSNIDAKILSHLDAYKAVRESYLSLAEILNENKINYHLLPFNFDIILDYFERNGVTLSAAHHKKIRNMLKNVNEFILSIGQSII
ncbi:putative flap endonuclease 1-like [Tupanvirus deep ocean]|uniref:Flap endonuclease 1-like n=2 Tax=Tupanvirus TaxID=2094720 RepID=A0AC62A8Y2_9VIRU|nr:putative flap endonuclease 1-like [Tupanvirus deep ocean]QKU34237.1 putative flap endonuclease 1-like [Tupanvirus deep ocean]